MLNEAGKGQRGSVDLGSNESSHDSLSENRSSSSGEESEEL